VEKPLPPGECSWPCAEVIYHHSGTAMHAPDCQRWIFDLDGTLTEAVHDFAAIRRELGLPEGRGILEALAELPPEVAAPLRVRLDAIELDLAGQARAAPSAGELLAELGARRVSLGILTRNSRENALTTLRAAGLAEFFAPDDVIGRDEAEPKPSPAGIRRLLSQWNGAPAGTVMVGDYLFDLLAGRRAGVHTVYVDVAAEFPFAEHADVRVQSLSELLALLSAPPSR
jgi:phosphoglycolate phosphatase-like HAD superfamily hydrolase